MNLINSIWNFFFALWKLENYPNTFYVYSKCLIKMYPNNIFSSFRIWFSNMTLEMLSNWSWMLTGGSIAGIIAYCNLPPQLWFGHKIISTNLGEFSLSSIKVVCKNWELLNNCFISYYSIQMILFLIIFQISLWCLLVF